MVKLLNIYLLLAGLVLIAASLACGAGSAPEGAAPEMTAPVDAVEPEEPSGEEPPPPVSLPTPTAVSGEEEPQPTIPESRRLSLEFPPVVRTGDSTRIRLQLEVDDRGNITPTAQIGGSIVTGGVVEIPNLYETHFVTAEARIDLAGVEVQPSGSIYEPMKPGQSVTFYWSIRPQETGVYRGTVWLHLVFMERVSGEKSRMTVSAQIVEIEAVDFFGFPVNFVRTSGVVGSVLGLVVGFPFLDDIIKFVLKSKRRKKA